MTEYPITPMGYVRRTYQGRFSERARRYHEYLNNLRLLQVEINKCGTWVLFVLPMPKSWSKTKRKAMNGMPHEQTPDTDNMLKALQDANYGKLDSCVWDISGTKIWGEEGKIIVGTIYDRLEFDSVLPAPGKKPMPYLSTKVQGQKRG